MATGSVDLGQFRPRPDEVLASALLGRVEGGETVRDIGLRRSDQRARAWVVATVALRHRGRLGLRRAVPRGRWHEVADLFDTATAPGRLERHPPDAPVRRGPALLDLSGRGAGRR